MAITRPLEEGNRRNRDLGSKIGSTGFQYSRMEAFGSKKGDDPNRRWKNLKMCAFA